MAAYPSTGSCINHDGLRLKPFVVAVAHWLRHTAHILQEDNQLHALHLRERRKLMAESLQLQRLLATGVGQPSAAHVQGGVTLARAATAHDDTTESPPPQQRDELSSGQVFNPRHVDQVGHVGAGHIASDLIALRCHSIKMQPHLEEGDAQAGEARPEVQHQPCTSDRGSPWNLS